MTHSRAHPPAVPDRVRQVEVLISTILRVGVLASLAVVIAGLVLSFVHHREYLHSSQSLQLILTPGHFIPHTLGELGQGLQEFRGESVILVGLLLLIATPVIRVAASVLIFLHERDWPFVAITIFVLAMLILSFVLGRAEG